MKTVFAFLIVAAFLFSFSGNEPHKKYTYTGKDYRVECEMLNGLYDGVYTSWYTNGKKKAQGNFKDNMRVGNWTVWDSTGQMKMKREYKNNFEFTRTFPAYNEGPAKLFSVPVYKLEYEEERIKYFFLNERAVTISKRIWRFIPRKKKSPVFSKEQLHRTLIDAALTNKAFVYEDDEFKIKMSFPLIQNIAPDQDKKTYNDSLIGYKIKEDWFFDNDRMISETRIIGICPVMLSGKDTVDAGWFYYPQLRATLCKEKINSENIPAYIHSLDDLFFFRYFYGAIYKESNVHDRSLKEYANGLMLEQERNRIEYSLIELEHDEWLQFAP